MPQPFQQAKRDASEPPESPVNKRQRTEEPSELFREKFRAVIEELRIQCISNPCDITGPNKPANIEEATRSPSDVEDLNVRITARTAFLRGESLLDLPISGHVLLDQEKDPDGTTEDVIVIDDSKDSSVAIGPGRTQQEVSHNLPQSTADTPILGIPPSPLLPPENEGECIQVHSSEPSNPPTPPEDFEFAGIRDVTADPGRSSLEAIHTAGPLEAEKAVESVGAAAEISSGNDSLSPQRSDPKASTIAVHGSPDADDPMTEDAGQMIAVPPCIGTGQLDVPESSGAISAAPSNAASFVEIDEPFGCSLSTEAPPDHFFTPNTSLNSTTRVEEIKLDAPELIAGITTSSNKQVEGEEVASSKECSLPNDKISLSSSMGRQETQKELDGMCQEYQRSIKELKREKSLLQASLQLVKARLESQSQTLRFRTEELAARTAELKAKEHENQELVSIADGLVSSFSECGELFVAGMASDKLPSSLPSEMDFVLQDPSPEERRNQMKNGNSKQGKAVGALADGDKSHAEKVGERISPSGNNQVDITSAGHPQLVRSHLNSSQESAMPRISGLRPAAVGAGAQVEDDSKPFADDGSKKNEQAGTLPHHMAEGSELAACQNYQPSNGAPNEHHSLKSGPETLRLGSYLRDVGQGAAGSAGSLPNQEFRLDQSRKPLAPRPSFLDDREVGIRPTQSRYRFRSGTLPTPCAQNGIHLPASSRYELSGSQLTSFDPGASQPQFGQANTAAARRLSKTPAPGFRVAKAPGLRHAAGIGRAAGGQMSRTTRVVGQGTSKEERNGLHPSPRIPPVHLQPQRKGNSSGAPSGLRAPRVTPALARNGDTGGRGGAGNVSGAGSTSRPGPRRY